MRLFLSLILGVVLTMPSDVIADDPLVFISAFAAGEKGAIHAFRFDSETGVLTPQHQTTDVQHPFFLVISPDGRFLYSIDTDKFGGAENEFVAAYSIEAQTGKLTRLNKQSAKGSASCYLDIDSSGKTVVLANYSTGSVAALPVQADGSLG
ncbi:MAG: 6-phosphogluconolactonase, partial [Planctomycetaceae bacterium]